ncbi:YjbF family lipoprotein [Vibrio mangrovi]|uniref:Putative lipoprotein GfcB n=1 Tax=Vibrio mangrovi TaxID=474394 RepID=A0A1Y6IZR8_9VIBR|nr:YjbF family lipoprotein [Vibrio mangrovi]MDW6002178.1 YjbF family lipoprotein [Vibrio mangrovi]SMS01523.1 putative lipoprotein GfcB precursor [Vibrio mangrovi]
MTNFPRISHYYYLLIINLLLLAGCSQSTQDLSDTIQSAFLGPDDNLISPREVDKLPYASLYVKMGDNPQALMILTWAEPTQSPNESVALKWLSANHEVLVTLSGRIVKTVNLRDGNIIQLESKNMDPLKLGLQKNSTPHIWEYKISWLPGYHSNYQAVSTFTIGNIESKDLPNGKKSLLHITEEVKIPQLKQQYKNDYWINPHTGAVIASEQHIFPGSEKIMLSVGKPYAGENNE